jgi:hypothetical protein
LSSPFWVRQQYFEVCAQQGLQSLYFADLFEALDRVPTVDVVWVEQVSMFTHLYAISSTLSLKLIIYNISANQQT